MGSPQSSVKIQINERIKEFFVVKKKLGEGSCGMVYLVKDSRSGSKCAMKVEAFMKSKEDEILKMEVYVLKHLQHSKHACRLLMAGKKNNFSFLIMSLLGRDLTDIRRRLSRRRMSLESVYKIGLQATVALRDIHEIGFIHRDVKPTNFAMGHYKKNTVFIFDFGLARQILFRDKTGKMVLREPRNRVSFRGTVRYCSLNVHRYKEQGRHDDLWGMVYMLVELLTSTLPWKGKARKETERIKETVGDKTLFSGCPSCFLTLSKHLNKLKYEDTPNYGLFQQSMQSQLESMKAKPTDPFEWNVSKTTNFKEDIDEKAAKDETAEIDKMEDTNTTKEVEDSEYDSTTEENGGYKEDTLENIQSVEK